MTEPYVKRLCAVLLDAVADKDPLVQEQVCGALHALGVARPEDTLTACEGYLRQHEKLAPPCRARILQAMETVLGSHLGELDKDTARALVLLAAHEMTLVKESVCDWQQAASSVLVAVGRRFVSLVMEELLTRFQPGALPHCFVVRTLADLAVPSPPAVFGTVPFLSSILSTMLPMLGWAKRDCTRVVFCYALQRFSESALEYLASPDQAPDPTIRRDSFAADILGAYEVLFHHWLQSREAKLRLAVVQALGPMSQLLPAEKLEEQLPRLLPGVLALYKKHAEAFPVSQSLGQILEAAVSVGSRTLEVQLDTLLAVLHAQICVPVESSSPLVLSNQREVLRCLTVLACCSPDRLLAFLLPKLDSSNERTRVGSLQILRHVINSAPARMEAKKPFILSALRLPLLDTSSKVKRAVVQVISAMAHHGYLEQPGGEVMVEFIVQQCALPAPPEPGAQDSEALAEDSVRSISVSTLYLVSSTVDRMSDVLWPYLLEFLMPVRFTGALTPLCRSLLHLAQKRQQARPDGCLVQYGARAALPSPFAIAARLLTVSCDPYAGDGRGQASLRLLQVLHGNVHPLLGPCWEAAIPLLLAHLDEHTEASLAQEEWEEKLLTFLQDTLAAVSDNTWTCQLSLEMCKQLPSYDGAPREKSFLYRCIGTALGAASDREVVRKHLQELLETARHLEGQEREGLACCFGICAISHLDDTLAQLEECVRSEVFRKSVGIFSLFKERSEAEAERVRCALILCYGQVAAQAPQELVLARVEADILRNMFLCFHTKVLGVKVESKDPALKLCLVRSVCAASRAVSSSAHAGTFHLAQKPELVAQMLEFIKAEPPDSLRTPICMKAMLTCTHLVPLEPALEEQLQASLAQGCLHRVLAVPPEPEGSAPGDQEALYLDTMQALGDLLAGLLHRNLTPQGLQVMVEHLRPWIKSPRGHERARALGLSARLLRHFLEHLHVSALVPFHNLGLLVGLFSPRCADLWPATRQEAVSCVHSLLYVQLGYEGFSRDHRDEVAERLLTLREGLVHPDPTILFHTCHSVAQIVAKRLPPDQLISLLLTLFEGLGDPDSNCSRAASVMISCLLKERGHLLLEKVPEMVSVLRCRLQETPAGHVLQAARHSIYLLATQHHAAVVSSLLGSPLPFDSHSCTLWRALAVEPSLTAQVLGLLLDKMGRDVPFKESRTFLLSSSPERVATLLPLAATCALRELAGVPEAGPAVLELYPRLFAALLLRVGCTLDVRLPRGLQAKEKRSPSSPSLEPCSSAAAALQAVLLRGGSEDVVQSVELEGGWELLRTSAGHEEGVALLASAMAKLAGPRLPPAVRVLLSAQSSVYEAQRVTATAFLAELLSSKVVDDLMLLDSLLDALVARQKDTSASVRRLALRGLANVASGSREQVQAHSPQLLTAMIAGLDDGDDPHSLVALEAMAGLARLLDLLDPWELRSVLLHVAIRVRPFFDSEKMEFRAASVQLFGRLNEA
ncbi:PREDICTED: maestro heat-like repeat-containing protein family member 1, partial [Condylura cristata]|uniref:maestro heat-like repeat-containing protein family member 1 n=1 Tax=Condylura cristata TaxID=143302 RepID=UPI0003345733